MTHIKNTVAAVVAAAALSLVVASCGDVEPPATDIGKSVEKKGPAPKGPTWDHPNRMDFGDGKPTLPAKPKPSTDDNPSRLNFGDNGRG